jgi:serine O-acetyltransferase
MTTVRNRPETAGGGSDSFRAALRARHPPLWEALLEDARVTARYRGERHQFRSRIDAAGQMLRLALVSDAFLAQALYRTKARLQALGVPLLPRLLHRLAMVTAQVAIGDPVLMEPGVYIAHGQVVIDGLSEIASGVVIFPFVTIGLRAGDIRGPKVQEQVSIGTGAKLIGPITVGARAQVGANAVVVDDVPADTTVVGSPARTVATPD